MRQKGPTIAERILLAANGLSKPGAIFTAEDLVVAAWQAAPKHFGLQGYADTYPDSNRVLTKIMGSGSVLRKKGWLSKVGSKQYRLTDVGRRAAEALRDHSSTADQTPTARLAELGRGHVSALRRMLESAALVKYSNMQPLTFSDVCGFWNISPRSNAHQLARQRTLADEAVSLALQAASAAPDNVVVLPGAQGQVKAADLTALAELSSQIDERFRPDLDVIRRRADERRSR